MVLFLEDFSPPKRFGSAPVPLAIRVLQVRQTIILQLFHVCGCLWACWCIDPAVRRQRFGNKRPWSKPLAFQYPCRCRYKVLRPLWMWCVNLYDWRWRAYRHRVLWPLRWPGWYQSIGRVLPVSVHEMWWKREYHRLSKTRKEDNRWIKKTYRIQNLH